MMQGPRKPRPKNPRRIDDTKRAEIRELLNSERFVDVAPEQVEAILLDEDTWVASARTMYRVLAEAKQVRDRRNRRRHPNYKKPELLANAPLQVWSWDITRLKGPAKATWFYLFVMLDLFSRFVVGWLLAQRENAELAQQFIRETMRKHGIEPGQLTLHQDRGSPMRAKSTRELMEDLGIAASFSRPRVSNDNPYSESHFSTLKQRPEMPERFGSPQHARQIFRQLFRWYNFEHCHSGIAMLTPAQVHQGKAAQVLAARHEVRLAAYRAHPERYINGPPKRAELPTEVWINRPVDEPSSPTVMLPSITDIGHAPDREPAVKAREATVWPLGLDGGSTVSYSATTLEVLQ